MKVGVVLVVKIGPNKVQYCEKTQKTGIINMCFSYFGLRTQFKEKNVVIVMSEWTFKVNIPQNTTFEGN